MSDLSSTSAACIDRVRQILRTSRGRALRSVNAAMLAAYWEIGREIVEEEQRGKARAAYGRRLIKQLSEALTEEFGRGYSTTNLKYIRRFYLTYQARCPPQISESVQIGHKPCDQSRQLSADLSWSHYRVLMRAQDATARQFYEVEAIRAGWSTSELERQIGSLLFERLALSRDQEGVLALAREGQRVARAEDLIKDPYVLEFTGLPEQARYRESDLEQALVDRLQQFLLELGDDLFFVARQKRLTIDGDHFHIDLVFYHRELRCFLLIDLKTGRLTQQDIGQMLLYVGYYATEEVREGENPPIGLILCTDKNEAVVRYTLAQSASQVFASRYQLHLPTPEQLRERILMERESLEANLDAEE